MFRILLWAPDRPSREFDASPAYSILVSAQRAGVPLRHDCGGRALCGTCRAKVVSGRLSPMSERERTRLSAVRVPLDGSVRLSCQSRAGTNLELEALLPLNGEHA